MLSGKASWEQRPTEQAQAGQAEGSLLKALGHWGAALGRGWEAGQSRGGRWRAGRAHAHAQGHHQEHGERPVGGVLGATAWRLAEGLAELGLSDSEAGFDLGFKVLRSVPGMR